MPSYASATDLEHDLGEARFAELVDRNADDVVDTDGVNAALEGASSTIDSYTARWLPLSTVPASIRRACIDIAVHDLGGEHVTEQERRRYEDALRWLRDLARGDASLSGVTPPSSTNPTILVDAPEAVMRRESTKGLL